jgi:2-keto-4-pentenoate hydratase/2-oxohepta-3-ene-1,7-dioic acid hydratase in catechol pathway
MRLATIVEAGSRRAALVSDAGLLPLASMGTGIASVREIAAAGEEGLRRVAGWAARQPRAAWRSLESASLGPALPDPRAIYTVGLNYRTHDGAAGPERPLIYGKAASSIVGPGATVSWDRSITDNVDAECELGVVIGPNASVFGYTIINDISSRDSWLDGDQWLLGKSMAGFCPVGPWIVPADELDPSDLRLGCTINGDAIQDGSTADMRFGISEIIAFMSRHLTLVPGDLIATGTPARLSDPPGPERRLGAGDVVTCWIEGIGELTNTIA